MKKIHLINEKIFTKIASNIPVQILQNWNKIMLEEFLKDTTPVKIVRYQDKSLLYIVAKRECVSVINYKKIDILYRINSIMGDSFIDDLIVKQREFIF